MPSKEEQTDSRNALVVQGLSYRRSRDSGCGWSRLPPCLPCCADASDAPARIARSISAYRRWKRRSVARRGNVVNRRADAARPRRQSLRSRLGGHRPCRPVHWFVSRFQFMRSRGGANGGRNLAGAMRRWASRSDVTCPFVRETGFHVIGSLVPPTAYASTMWDRDEHRKILRSSARAIRNPSGCFLPVARSAVHSWPAASCRPTARGEHIWDGCRSACNHRGVRMRLTGE